MRLILIRHGESTANAEGRLQGHADYGLSDLGRWQSERVAERLAAKRIDFVYASPLRRAWETAIVLGQRLGLEPSVREGLKERDVGELSGLSRAEILERYPEFQRERAAGRIHEIIPGWEGDEAFNTRVSEELHYITDSHDDGQTVAAVTHGGIIAAVCRQVLDLPIVRPGPFATSNAGITVLQVSRNGTARGDRPAMRLVTLNDVCHLEALPDGAG